MIRLSVPGTLKHRDLVLRVVSSSCKLLRAQREETQEARHAQDHDEQFDNKVVSAVSEAFNNIAIHGYAGGASGQVELQVEIERDRLVLHLRDSGKSFDFEAAARDAPSSLPESHMGLYIIRSFMDEVSYQAGDGAGSPNVLTLLKRY